ncbi:MAG: HNH endonuclease [Bacilli bacterium]
MLISKFVEVVVSNDVKYYEELGYLIPKYKDNHYRWAVKRGTKIYVKVSDVPHKSTVRIKVKCDYCGEIYYPKISDYYNGHKTINKDSCNNCKQIKIEEIYNFKYGTTSIKVRADVESFIIGRHKTDGDIIYNAFLSKGVTPIFKSEDYTGAFQDLPYVCTTHKEKGILYRTYDSIRDLDCACKYCNIEKSQDEKRYDFEFVKEKFIEKNYTLLSTEYFNIDDELEFICNYHPEEGIQHANFWNVLHSINNCTRCRYNMQSEDLHWNWQGGLSLERDKISQTKEYQQWRMSIFQRDYFICQCCESKSNKLNAHHIQNFSNFPDLRLDINNGITLCEDCHSINKKGSFHNIYGTKNNTREQLEEYIQRYKNGDFNKLRLKNIS